MRRLCAKFRSDWTEWGEGMMDSERQLQEAKGELRRPIKRAAAGDAQVVTVHDKPTAVVDSAEEYARLTRRRKLCAALPRSTSGRKSPHARNRPASRFR